MRKSSVIFPPEECAVIRAHWNGRKAKSSREIAAIIRRAFGGNKNHHRIENQAKRMRLVRDQNYVEPMPTNFWTEEQKTIVRAHWNGPGALPDVEIGALVGKSRHAVHRWARDQGMVRDPGWAENRMKAGWRAAHPVKPEEAILLPSRRVTIEDLAGSPIRAGDWPEDAPLFQDEPRILARYLTKWNPVRLKSESAVPGASSLGGASSRYMLPKHGAAG